MLGFIILILGAPALVFLFLARFNRIPPDPYIQGQKKCYQFYHGRLKKDGYFSPYPQGSAEDELWWDGFRRAGDEIVASYQLLKG